METLRLLHAADLHLGAPMESLPADLRPAEREKCAGATLAAWRRLVSTALEEEVDLVVLAGNTLSADAPLEARVWLREGLEELGAEKIPVVLVAGEQDPLASPLWAAVDLPPGCHLLTPENNRFELRRRGEVVAVVMGDAQDTAALGGRLPRALRRDPAFDNVLQLAVRHGEVTSERRVGDLRRALRQSEVQRSGLDAWLLGGSHRRSITSASPPLIHDPGPSQARWPDEEGERGCSLIEWRAGATEPRCEARPLAEVVWHRQVIAIASDTPLSEAVHEVLKQLAAELPREPELLLLKITIQGSLSFARRGFEGALKSALDQQFHSRAVLAELLIEALPIEARGGEQKSFAEVVLAGLEGGAESKNRERLLNLARQTLSRVDLPLERSASQRARGETAGLWPRELEIDLESELDQLLSMAAAEALWALNLEDA